MPFTNKDIPIGTRTLILSKLYYGVLSKNLEELDIDRYFAILHYVSKNKSCCQKDICQSLYIDKTAMVKILDTLAEAGLIERKTNPDDRRQHYVSLSKKGEKQAKLVEKNFEKIDKQIFSNISEKDKEIFTETLKQLMINLSEIPKNDLFFNYKKTK